MSAVVRNRGRGRRGSSLTRTAGMTSRELSAPCMRPTRATGALSRCWRRSALIQAHRGHKRDWSRRGRRGRASDEPGRSDRQAMDRPSCGDLRGGRRCLLRRHGCGDHRRVAAALLPLAKELGLPDFDAAALKFAVPRDLTQQVASHIYQLRYSVSDELFDGVRFASRHGNDLAMWAIFERPGDEPFSHRL